MAETAKGRLGIDAVAGCCRWLRAVFVSHPLERGNGRGIDRPGHHLVRGGELAVAGRPQAAFVGGCDTKAQAGRRPRGRKAPPIRPRDGPGGPGRWHKAGLEDGLWRKSPVAPSMGITQASSSGLLSGRGRPRRRPPGASFGSAPASQNRDGFGLRCRLQVGDEVAEALGADDAGCVHKGAKPYRLCRGCQPARAQPPGLKAREVCSTRQGAQQRVRTLWLSGFLPETR